MPLIFINTKSRTLATIAILVLVLTNFSNVPAQAATPTFTITDPITGQPLTTITGIQGVPLNKTYNITFSDTGWDFTAQPNGNGSDFYIPTGQEGLTANVSFPNSTMTVSGTLANGGYFNSYLEVYDGTGENGYKFPFQVAIAPIVPTPHITVDAANHTYGDVTGLNTTGLFTSMPSIYLNTANSGTLVELTPADNLGPTTTVNNGVTTIAYTTGPLYVDETGGSIYADVAITIMDGTVSYEVQTYSEGDPVAAGDVVFQGNLAGGADTSSGTAAGGLGTFSAGNPFVVFSTADGAMPTEVNGAVTMTSPSIAVHSFEFSFFDYIGCPTLNELVTAYETSMLTVTGYESATICPLPTISFDKLFVDGTGQVVTATLSNIENANSEYAICTQVNDTIQSCSLMVTGIASGTATWEELREYLIGFGLILNLTHTWSIVIYAAGDIDGTNELPLDSATPVSSASFEIRPPAAVVVSPAEPPVVVPPVVVAPVTNGTHTPTSRNSSTLSWAANKAPKTIEVRVNDKVIATLDGTAITHVTAALIGPKDKVEAIAKDAAGNSSVLASFTYVAKGDIALGGVLFGADSAKLTPASKALLKKYAAAIVEHGFTIAKVAAFTKFDASRTSAFRTKLAKARAAAITTYLNEQFKAAGVTVKIIAAGKGVKARSGEVSIQ